MVWHLLQVSCQKTILAGFKEAEIIGFSEKKQARNERIMS